MGINQERKGLRCRGKVNSFPPKKEMKEIPQDDGKELSFSKMTAVHQPQTATGLAKPEGSGRTVFRKIKPGTGALNIFPISYRTIWLFKYVHAHLWEKTKKKFSLKCLRHLYRSIYI